MLTGIHPLLTGELLWHLDSMGHSDVVVVADAHFPASRLGPRVVTLPGSTTPEVLDAIRTVIPLDDAPALYLMTPANEVALDVHHELMEAAGTDASTTRWVDRYDFYDLAQEAFVIIRTGEQRTYGNALLPKGIVQTTRDVPAIGA